MAERPSNGTSWFDANHRYLLAAVGVVRATLEDYANRFVTEDENRIPDRRAEAAAEMEAATEAMPGIPALERLVRLFGLTPFERDTLLLGAGMETFSNFGLLCAAAHNDEQRPHPTFRLALDAFPNAHWDALSPDSSLRRWRMVELDPGPSMATSPLRIAERVLHEILGVDYLDERLAGVLESIPLADAIAPSHKALAERVAKVWEDVDSANAFPTVQLAGGTVSDRRAVAATACALLGRNLKAMSATILPVKPEVLEDLRRIWELEGALSNSALLLECDNIPPDDHARREALAWLAEHALGGVLLSTDQRQTGGQRPLVTVEIDALPTDEQRKLWHEVLEKQVLDGHLSEEEGNKVVQRLATQFHLGAPAIRAAGFTAIARRDNEGANLDGALWEACRLQARPQLDDLAQRIVPSATWEHLVLPGPQREMLRQVAIHVRQRQRVYEDWGFDGQGGRGLGVTALFAGSSGTGKTMAAEVLADELKLDLYRVDLSSVVSKYIGETEKNLRKIFDAAETGGVILLFDEADALFGKRSEVKDSHDRHANVEVSYLLQRMEAYRGLAILTTNIKGALDVAFTRRLRFIVNFPFPDVQQRAEIWRRVFPSEAPTQGLNADLLARLNATGGLIRNIALSAAFLAADEDEPVTMRYLLRAARSEYAKLDRQISPAEISGWEQSGRRVQAVLATSGKYRSSS